MTLLPSHTASILCIEKMLSSSSHHLQPFFCTSSLLLWAPASLILTFVSFCLSSPSADFHHFFPLLSHPPFSPLLQHCISLSALLYSCPPIPLLFLHSYSPLFTLHKPSYSSLFPLSFFTPVFWQSELVSSICSVLWPESVTAPTSLQQWPPHTTHQRLKGNLQGYYAMATTLEIHHSQKHWF